MTTINISPAAGKPRTPSPAKSLARRLFYPLSAVFLLATTLYGFKDFFFHGQAYPGRPLTPPIRTLLIVHGIAMLGWILLFIVQPTLIAMRKHKAHMLLGRVGALLAVALVVLGYLVAVGAARANPPDLKLFGMLPPQFLYVPLTSIALFGVMVGLAIWKRKKPELHRALMLIATVSAVSAATGRITWVNELFDQTIWFSIFGPLHSAVTLSLILLAARCAVIRRFDKGLMLCATAMVVISAAMHVVSTTPAWDSFARWLIG